MAKIMLTPHSNGRTGSVGGLLNLGGGDMKEGIIPRARLRTLNQNVPKFWANVFTIERPALQSHPSITSLASPVSPLLTPLYDIPNSALSCQTDSSHLDQIDKASRNLFASLGSTSQNKTFVHKWRNTQCGPGGCPCMYSGWFEGRVINQSLLRNSDLSKLTTMPRPSLQELLQGGSIAGASHPPGLAKFVDEQTPQEPVDSWEELDENSAVKEEVYTASLDDSSMSFESMEPCSEAEYSADDQLCDDAALQPADTPKGDVCKEIKTQHSDSSKNSTQKSEHGDLTYVLFDRRGKCSGKTRKRRRQSKQKSKQCGFTSDSSLHCLDLDPALEDAFPAEPSAPCEKGKSAKSARKKKSKDKDDFGCDLVDQCLSFLGLGDFLPGSQKSVPASVPTCPRIADCQADAVPVPSKKIRELNLAWGISPKKPTKFHPKRNPNCVQHCRICENRMLVEVSFAEGKGLATTHLQVAWDFAYRAARRGHWHLCSLDHKRFQERVARVGRDVEWVLAPEHRSTVYAKCFSCDDKTE